jgi:hypothetical protein
MRTKSALAVSEVTGALVPAAIKGLALAAKTMPTLRIFRNTAEIVSAHAERVGADALVRPSVENAPAFVPQAQIAPKHQRSSLPPAMSYNLRMANLTLVYGLRLLPSEEVAEVEDATLKLKNGREAHVTMHMLEGSKEQIEKQLKSSLDAFFDFYPEI